MCAAALAAAMCGLAVPAAAQADMTVTVVAWDPAHPDTVTATVAGAQDGLIGGEIDLRPLSGGGAIVLDTRIEGTTLIAHVDVDSLAAGVYDVLAVAVDGQDTQRASNLDAAGRRAQMTVSRRADSAIRFDAPPRSGSTLNGRVVSQGQPVAGVLVHAQRRIGDAAWQTFAQAATAADGTFAFAMSHAGPSEQVRVVADGDAAHAPVTALSGTITRRARVSLRADRATARLGQSVRFSGAVTGPGVPPSGVRIALEAYDRGRWVRFIWVRSGPDGAFSYRYRFRRSYGVVTYPFRAVVPAQAGLPYAKGSSGAAHVKVIGIGR